MKIIEREDVSLLAELDTIAQDESEYPDTPDIVRDSTIGTMALPATLQNAETTAGATAQQWLLLQDRLAAQWKGQTSPARILQIAAELLIPSFADATVACRISESDPGGAAEPTL